MDTHKLFHMVDVMKWETVIFLNIVIGYACSNNGVYLFPTWNIQFKIIH